MSSSAPPASPALIMFTYSRLKHFGLLAMPSERVEPASISSHVSSSEYLRRPPLACPAKIRRLRKIGKPASCKIESCRVNVVRSRDRTPPNTNPRFFLAPAVSAFLRGFFFGRRFDHVFDLSAGRVHRFELKSWHL